MGDQIDIGVRIGTTQADIQAAERAGAAVQQFTLSAKEGAKILASVGNDYDKFREKVAALKAQFDATQKAAAAPASAQGAQDLATQANVLIGRFTALSRTIDTTNAAAVKGFRAQGDALSVELIKLGATEAEINKIGNAIAALERRAGSAQIAPRLALSGVGNIERIPASARTAANAISLISQAAITGQGSMAGLANAAGSVAFGLSNLSNNARIIAGASGIGAVVSIVGVMIELLHRGSEATREQTAALKELGQTPEFLNDTSRAVAQLVERLGQLKGFKPGDFTLVGGTPEQQKALKDLAAAQADLSTRSQVEQLTQLGGTVASLKQQLSAGAVSITQYRESLVKLGEDASKSGTAFPGMGEFLQQATEAGEKFNAATLQLRKANAKAVSDQLNADKELAKNLADTNAELRALRSGGASAARQTQDEQRALELATKAWEAYTVSEEGATFGGIKFAAALKQVGTDVQRQAQQRLTDARAFVAARRAIDEGLRPKADPETAADARAAIQAAKTQADAEIEARRAAFDRGSRDLKTQLAAEQITRTEFIEQTKQLEVRAADDRLKIRSGEFDKEQAALEREQQQLQARPATPERDAALTRVRGDLQALANERRKAISQADDETNKAEENALQQAAEIAKRITDATTQAMVAILRATGQTEKAAALEAQQQSDAIIREIQQSVGKNAPQISVQLRRRDVEQARIAVQQIQNEVTQATDTLQARLAEINAEVTSHAISQAEGRKQIVAAETEARDVIAAQIPLLEQRAKELDNDPRLANQVLQLKTRLLELNEAIREQTDAFFKLKQVGLEETQSALAGFAEAGAKLLAGGQNKQAIVEVHSLAIELDSAKQELEDLLAIPAEKRTALQNSRITELRGQVAQLSVEFENAKQAITTWRDLAVQAIEQVLEALVHASAQMVATSAIQAFLAFFLGGGGGGSPIKVLSGDTLPPGTQLGASGGLVLGPGTATSDSIPARVSNREFIQPAASTDYYGVPVMEGMRRRAIPREFFNVALGGTRPFEMRSAVSRVASGVRHFADGGLVSASDIAAHGAGTVVRHEHHIRVGLSKGLVAEEIKSDAGARAIITVVADKQDSFNAALGRG